MSTTTYQVKKKLTGGYSVGYACPHCAEALTSPLDEAGTSQACPACDKRLRGWQALTTPQAGNQRTSDIDQITYATQNGYSIITYNVTDFPRLHNEILASGGTHAGIIVATQERPSAIARALLSLLGAFTAEDFVDQLIYLSNWITD